MYYYVIWLTVLIDSRPISQGEKLQNHLTSSSLYIHPTCSLVLLRIVNASNLESNWYDIYKKKKKKKKELLLASTKSPERLMICFWQTKQYYYCLYNVYRQFLRHSRSTKSSFVWSPESGGRSTRPINPRNIFFSISFSFLSLLSAHTHTHKSFLV